MTDFDRTPSELHADEVIASWLLARDEGRMLDAEQIVARHPEIAPALRAFLADQDLVRRFARDRDPIGDADATRTFAGDGRSVAARERVEVGQIFAGRYRILGLASGGMGRIYFADDLRIARDGVPLKVAIKSVADYTDWKTAREAHGADAEPEVYQDLLARFKREALAWIRLGMHPNVVWAMWVIDVGAKPYLVMEYADGGDLRAWIARRPGVGRVVDAALQICQGMTHAVSTAGMVHRDLKPANVLVKGDRIVKITDFGLCKAFAADPGGIAETAAPGYTMSAIGAGTPAYMAPEQFLGLGMADTRSDIFSFGAMLFEMATAKPLFSPHTSALLSRLGVPVPDVRDVDASLPEALAKVIARCLEYEPSRRYPSFDALASALADVRRGLSAAVDAPIDAAHARTVRLLTPSLRLLAETYTLISLGRHADAVTCADQAIAIDPDNFEHWVNKSKALIALRNYGEARACGLTAIRLQPGDARAWANLGWAALMLGDVAAALEAAERAIALDAAFADAWMCRGECQRALASSAEAVSSLRHAAQLEPHNWKAHASLGFCLKDLGRFEDAIASQRRAVGINPDDAQCWLEIGWLHARTGDWRQSREAIDRSLHLDAASAAVWAMRAWAIWSEGSDRAEAWRALQRAREIDPDSHHVRVMSRVLSGEMS